MEFFQSQSSVVGNIKSGRLNALLCSILPDMLAQNSSCCSSYDMGCSVIFRQTISSIPNNCALDCSSNLWNVALDLVNDDFADFLNIHNFGLFVAEREVATVCWLSATFREEACFV